MTPQIIITNTGVFDIVAGIGVQGKSILVGGGTVTGGGGGTPGNNGSWSGWVSETPEFTDTKTVTITL